MRGSLRVALVSVFSALFFLVTEFVRGIPVLGLPRGRIQPSVVLVPLLGTVLGPAMGPLAALLGITAAAAYPAPSADPFSLLNIAAPALGTLCSALVTESGRRSVAGPLALLAALLSVWFATDVGRSAPHYVSIHVAALLAAVLLARFCGRGRAGPLALAASAALSGVMTDHLVGSVNGVLARIYIAAIPVVLVERGLMVAVAVAVTAPVVYVLRGTHVISVVRPRSALGGSLVQAGHGCGAAHG